MYLNFGGTHFLGENGFWTKAIREHGNWNNHSSAEIDIDNAANQTAANVKLKKVPSPTGDKSTEYELNLRISTPWYALRRVYLTEILRMMPKELITLIDQHDQPYFDKLEPKKTVYRAYIRI